MIYWSFLVIDLSFDLCFLLRYFCVCVCGKNENISFEDFKFCYMELLFYDCYNFLF